MTSGGTGSMLLVLLTCGLLALVHGQVQPPTPASYLVTAPSKLWPNTNFDFTVLVLQGSSSVAVVGTILLDDKTEVARSLTNVMPGRLTQVSLAVPDIEYGAYKLKVEGTGSEVRFTNETSISYGTKSYSVLIQFDKPIYKPGQQVRFRVFSINARLLARSIAYNIKIYDGKMNKIRDYELSPTSQSNVILEDSLQLSEQPVLGDWKMRVTPAGSTDYEEKVFKVEEYVLPKFEAKLELPSFHVLNNQDFVGKVGGVYTYGEDVDGTAKVEITHGRQTLSTTIAVKELKEFSFSAREMKELRVYLSSSTQTAQVKVKASVTEKLTELTHHTEATLTLAYRPYVLQFLSGTPTVIRPGLQFVSMGKLTQPDGSALPSGVNYVVESEVRVQTQINEPRFSRTSLTLRQRYTVPPQMFTHEFDLPDNTSDITLKFTVKDSAEDVSVSKHVSTKFKSPSNNGIQVILLEKDAQNLEFEVKTTEVVPKVYYQIISRGRIVMASSLDMAGQMEHTWQVPVHEDMAPSPRITVYYLHALHEIVVDTVGFKLDGVFRHDVTLSFNKERAEPKEAIDLTVSAEPNSEVALLAVDKSVLLLASGNDITEQDVEAALQEYQLGTKSSSDDGGDIGIPEPQPVFRRKRQAFGPSLWFPWFPTATDASSIFQQTGLEVMSDGLIYSAPKDVGCSLCGGGLVNQALAMPGAAPGQQPAAAPMRDQPEAAPASSVPRLFFPESWLWSHISTIDATGTESLSLTAPDTITSWVASAFALHTEHGLGIAQTASFETFLRFFVSLKLPYSLIRGEETDLQVNVFNYMKERKQVTVTLKGSMEFSVYSSPNSVEARTNMDVTRIVTVEADSAERVFFNVAPKKIGMITFDVSASTTGAADRVQRAIRVKPEGTRVDFNYAQLVTLKDNGDHRFTQPINIPQGAVPQSAYVTVQVIGDIMGPVLQGLDSLLMMPTGCGEQTMLTLAPNIYVLDYMTETGQTNSDIKDKATGFMLSGYQRELTYKHSRDGSFSAFGESDKSGSSWLTAFVARCFKQAMKYIVIDDGVISQALRFLRTHQNSDGSFKEPGRVIHSDMQGQASGGVALSAYIVGAMLEAGSTTADNSVRQGINYLKRRATELTDPYPLALIAYALSLAKDSYLPNVVSKLDDLRTEEDGVIYWHKPEAIPAQSKVDSRRWHYPVPSADVEMTAYALMVYSNTQRLNEGSQIVKWLTKQRNSLGGFSSTQNTVIGLQALSVFAASSQANSFNVDVTATSQGNTHEFQTITKDNSMTLQKWEVPAPDNVQSIGVEVQGQGVALVQVSGFYHLAETGNQQSGVSVQVDSVSSRDNKTVILTVCATGGGSSMGVVEVNLLSGYIAEQPEGGIHKGLKRVEINNGFIALYWDEFEKARTGSCAVIVTKLDQEVRNLQPAVVIAYDYYNPKHKARAMYAIGSKVLCPGCESRHTTSSAPYVTSTALGVLLLSVINLVLGCLLMC